MEAVLLFIEAALLFMALARPFALAIPRRSLQNLHQTVAKLGAVAEREEEGKQLVADCKSALQVGKDDAEEEDEDEDDDEEEDAEKDANDDDEEENEEEDEEMVVVVVM
eukprot:2095228-Rhodomonas_salina.1